MNYRLVFHNLVRIDIQDSYEWYKNKKAGLGNKFLKEVEKQLNIILKNPNSFPSYHKPFREKLLDRFPFVIIYYVAEKEKEIFISSIYNTYRDPLNKFRPRT